MRDPGLLAVVDVYKRQAMMNQKASDSSGAEEVMEMPGGGEPGGDGGPGGGHGGGPDRGF